MGLGGFFFLLFSFLYTKIYPKKDDDVSSQPGQKGCEPRPLKTCNFAAFSRKQKRLFAAAPSAFLRASLSCAGVFFSQPTPTLPTLVDQGCSALASEFPARDFAFYL